MKGCWERYWWFENDVVLPGEHSFWNHQCARKRCTKEHPTHPWDLPTTLKLLVVPKLTEKKRSSGGARKGTGDTKTKWYYLGSTHFGITSAHTNLSPRNPKYTYLTDQVITVLILKAISTSSVLKRSTSPLYSPRALAIPTSNEHLPYQQYSLIPLIEANINVTLR